jgi:hypothetical protein
MYPLFACDLEGCINEYHLYKNEGGFFNPHKVVVSILKYLNINKLLP